MFLDKEKLDKVAKLIKKKILRDDVSFKKARFSFICNIFNAVILAVAGAFHSFAVIDTICLIFLALSTACTVVSGGLLLIKLKEVKQTSRGLAVKYSLEYDDYDALINELNEALGIDRKENMDKEVEYTKDGRPIIDVEYEEVPQSGRQDHHPDFVVEHAPEPRIIDVDYTPVEDVTLAQNIAYLREYVNDVAYEGYEKDLAIIDTMYELVISGTVTGPVLDSIEDSLHTLTEAIFLKACKHYDLPSTRKRTNPEN